MTFHEILDDSYIDLPDWYTNSIEFNSKLTCMDISPHGRMIVVGQIKGSVKVMDSETGGGKKEIYDFGNSVTSVSFSRDGKLVCGVSKKKVSVVNIITEDIVFLNEYPDNISFGMFSRKDPNVIFILSSGANKSIYRININTKESVQVEGEFTCFNLLNDDTIVGGLQKNVTMIKPDGEKNVISTPARRGITAIEVSHDGKMIVALDKSGAYTLIDLKDGNTHTFKDHMNGAAYSTATFDRSDQHFIVGSAKMSDSAFTSFEINSYQMKPFTNGPKEAILQLCFHPLQPFIYARAAKRIHVWKPVYRDRWSHSVPEYNNLLSNEAYVEPENEFDEGHESGRKELPRHLNDPIDIFTREKYNALDDDSDYPDQCISLPIVLDEIESYSYDEEDYDETE